MFVGRTPELEHLKRRLEEVSRRGQGQLLVVRGRRQVGKSALFTRMISESGLPSLYFTATKSARLDAQMSLLAFDAHNAVVGLAKRELLFNAPCSSWADVFQRIALSVRESSSPVIIVLDEYPWAVESDPTLDGTLQVAWDRDLQHLPILLVLIGSEVSVMDRLSDHDRPLFGRGEEMVVTPLSVADCAKALGFSRGRAVDAFDAHLITGGYPRMVIDMRDSKSPYEYVRSRIVDESSVLSVFAQRTLSAEFNDASTAASLLRGIGHNQLGQSKFGEMVGLLESESPSTTARALRHLVETKQVVLKEVPSGEPLNSKAARYRVADSYLRFWFRFIEPNLANVSRGRTDLALAAFERDWSTWRGLAIEPVVREALFRLAPTLGFPDVSSVSGWWTRNNSVEIDVVGARRKEVAFVGSIKWRMKQKITIGEIAQLRIDRARVPRSDDAAIVAVCPSGFEKGIEADVSLNAADLLAAWK